MGSLPASNLPGSEPHLSVHAVRVYVANQERSVRFYVDQLGFRLAFDARLQSGQRWVAVAPPDGTTVLTLIEPTEDSEEYKLIGRPTHIVFVTDNVAAKYREWSARGVHFRNTPRLKRIKYDRKVQRANGSPGLSDEPLWGGVFARFEDLDHNTFALVSFDEVSRAIEAQRRAVAEKQEAERRASQELEIARQVQARLFPQRLPISSTLEYAGACIPARGVGGDYYDFLDLGHERLGLVIGDIAGKGMAAALLMANLQANIRSQCAIAVNQPQQFLRAVNELLYENTTESSYATLFFAEYDDHTRRLQYVNCGHLSGFLFRDGGNLEVLDSTSCVLGLFKRWDCSVGERLLLPGDMLALYTDGITEAFSPDGEEFGEQRLIELLQHHRKSSCQALLDAVLHAVGQFSPHEQHDDITLLVAKCRASEPAGT